MPHGPRIAVICRMANRPPRFRDFDYAGFNRYFLTICVKDRRPVFMNTDYGAFVVAQLLLLATAFHFEILASRGLFRSRFAR
jgi:hypothetical protein